MNERQAIGGVSALVASATVIVGLVMFATALTDYATGDPTAGESVSFLVDNEATIYMWNLVTLIVFSIALVPLALALNERTRAGSPATAQTATAFGLIWAGLLIAAGMILNIGSGVIVDLHRTAPAEAESLWLAVDSVANGLSGGMEIVGPLWVLLASWAALRAEVLPRALATSALSAAWPGSSPSSLLSKRSARCSGWVSSCGSRGWES